LRRSFADGFTAVDQFIFHNNRIASAADVRIEPTSAGLLYGWGVFTTLRVFRGAPFQLDRHWDRLVRHAEIAEIPLPISLPDVRRAFDNLIKANILQNGRARVTLLRGDAGAWRLGPSRQSDLLIFTSSEEPKAASPIAITVSPHRVLSHGPLAGVKRTAMLENLLALEEARERGFSEAIMVNERGEITGAAAANVFWTEGSELCTPSLGAGCISGITRGIVHEIAEGAGLHVVEGGFPIQRLLDANEVFLTSTARGISAVSSFDIKRYNIARARVTRMIAREFQKMIRGAKISAS